MSTVVFILGCSFIFHFQSRVLSEGCHLEGGWGKGSDLLRFVSVSGPGKVGVEDSYE